jgi:hypothetical protein
LRGQGTGSRDQVVKTREFAGDFDFWGDGIGDNMETEIRCNNSGGQWSGNRGGVRTLIVGCWLLVERGKATIQLLVAGG